MTAFLDIETDEARRPIAVGVLRDSETRQAVAKDPGWVVDPCDVVDLLRLGERLVTFNGASFDLPILRALSPGLARKIAACEHVDLYPLARAARLSGGLKEIEYRIGFRAAEAPERAGRVYARWAAWREHGDAEALRELLDYNRDDLLGTEALYRRLLALGAVLPRFG